MKKVFLIKEYTIEFAIYCSIKIWIGSKFSAKFEFEIWRVNGSLGKNVNWDFFLGNGFEIETRKKNEGGFEEGEEETNRQTDWKQVDRRTERQTDRYTDRQISRQTDRQTDKPGGRQTDNHRKKGFKQIYRNSGGKKDLIREDRKEKELFDK